MTAINIQPDALQALQHHIATPGLSLAELERLVGHEVSVSDWIAIDQTMVNAFADVTRDRQFIHVDPERAAASPFGGTIAHGFLSLSLLSHFGEQCLPAITTASITVNYGFDSIRFLSPVPVGSRVRARFTLKEIAERGPGRLRSRYAVVLELDGNKKPALIAEWLTLTILS